MPVIVSDIPANKEVGLQEECYSPVGNIDSLTKKLRYTRNWLFDNVEASEGSFVAGLLEFSTYCVFSRSRRGLKWSVWPTC